VHKDLVSGAEQLVDQARCNSVTPSDSTARASISDNGDVVAFASSSEALVPRDTNRHDDVFVWRTTVPCRVQRVSAGPGSRQGDGDSYWPAVSGDGSSVAFISRASNLVDNDTNAQPDAFVVRIGPPKS
jgi:Tol biopolymer transport system component